MTCPPPLHTAVFLKAINRSALSGNQAMTWLMTDHFLGHHGYAVPDLSSALVSFGQLDL